MDEHARAYQAYLAAHHAWFGVSPAALAHVVQAATGPRLATSERIVKGADNEVYGVATADGREDLSPHMTRVEREDALRKMGAMLARLHSVHTAEFYKRSDGRWDFATWTEWMTSVIDARTADEPCLRRAGLDGDEVASAFRALERCTPTACARASRA